MSLGPEEFAKALTTTISIPVPYFDNTPIELFDPADWPEGGLDVLNNFLALDQSHRHFDTRHVFAYFESIVGMAGDDLAREEMNPWPDQPDEIWNYVYPSNLAICESWEVGDPNKSAVYVVLEANCGWEIEHGLQMSWRNGNQLVLVSGYTGHPTNGASYADVTKDAFVYFDPWGDGSTLQNGDFPIQTVSHAHSEEGASTKGGLLRILKRLF